ncbi:MAG: molybdopterin converting factor subunit 1 [Thermomicrobiales bacterium]|nr:molybdopterin converting factor subunit 1 [Thermomicrobiales bacterium]
MTIELRFFAGMREALGRSSERLVVPAGSTAAGVLDRLVAEQPKLDRLRPVLMVMVNQAYADRDAPLADGDELAFIPPVSGGSATLYRVQEDPIDAREVEAAVRHPGAGAVITFSGTVRDHGRGQAVQLLEYEAYAPAAERMMAQVGDEIVARWPVTGVAMVHRVGALPVGEVSVVIAVSSAHRDAAFEASRYAIERLKEVVPIWKKEHYADGAAWLGSEHDYQVEIGRLPQNSE